MTATISGRSALPRQESQVVRLNPRCVTDDLKTSAQTEAKLTRTICRYGRINDESHTLTRDISRASQCFLPSSGGLRRLPGEAGENNST